MKKNILLILFLISGTYASAQIPKNELEVDTKVFPEEKTALYTNTNILMAGESLLYKISILKDSNKNSELSKVAYVSLRDQNDSIIFHHKLKLKTGNANGSFFLPANLKTGSYSLIGYTNFSRNHPTDAFDSKNIYIINTFQENVSASQSPDTIKVNAVPQDLIQFSSEHNKVQAVSIKPDKSSYNFREKVTLGFNGFETENGNYLLSVRQVNPVEISQQVRESRISSNNNKFYIPELRGELISGRVISSDDNSGVSNQVVALSIPGKDFIFKLAKTDKYGRFFLSITENYESEKSILQIVDVKENYDLVIDNNDIALSKAEDTFLKLDPNLKEWLEDRSVQLQIENAYFERKKDSLIPRSLNPAFYDQLGTLYALDDYTRFPSVRETFIEVIKLAAIRSSGDKRRFMVNNPYDPKGYGKFRDIPPLVLMDGMLIQNNEELLNYNPMDIKSIRVVNTAYRYGPQLYSGIISVTTKKGDFTPSAMDYIKEINLPPTQQERRYFSPNYQNSQADRIPDYRIQLLWAPQINLPSTDPQASFYTSDVPGTYEIRLEGFDANGKEVEITNYIEVLGE